MSPQAPQDQTQAITAIEKDDGKVFDEQLEKKDTEEGHLETRYAHLTKGQVFRVFWRCMIFVMIANWAALNDGFQQQMPGNVLPMQPFIDTMHDTVINGVPTISSQVVSFWQGFGEMAKMAGQASGVLFSDRIGRKWTLVVVCAFLIGGAIGEYLANDWKAFLAGSMVVKYGVGIATATLVTYVSEIAPFQIRGTCIAAYQLFLGMGQLLSAIAAKIITETNPTEWRPLIASEFCFTGVLCILLFWLPESHLFYARKGKHEQAKKVMLRIYGTAPNYDLEHEYAVIQNGLEAEKAFSEHKGSFFEIFRGINLRRTLAGTIGICTQSVSGGVIFWGYSTYFFTLAGMDDPFLVTVITFLLLIVTVGMGMQVVEYVGRRPMLLGGCFAMLLFNTGLATTGFFDTRAASQTALGMLLLWVMAYGISTAGLGYVAAAETSTPRLRALTTSFNMACYGTLYTVFQWAVPYIINEDAANLGVKGCYIFAGILVPTIVLIYFLYPETTGRTYIELDELYERRIPAWKFKSTKTASDLSGSKTKTGGPVEPTTITESA